MHSCGAFWHITPLFGMFLPKIKHAAKTFLAACSHFRMRILSYRTTCVNSGCAPGVLLKVTKMVEVDSCPSIPRPVTVN